MYSQVLPGRKPNVTWMRRVTPRAMVVVEDSLYRRNSSGQTGMKILLLQQLVSFAISQPRSACILY